MVKKKINKKTVYFKNYYESGIVYVNDISFNPISNDSFDYFAKKKKRKSTFFNGQASDTLYLSF